MKYSVHMEYTLCMDTSSISTSVHCYTFLRYLVMPPSPQVECPSHSTEMDSVRRIPSNHLDEFLSDDCICLVRGMKLVIPKERFQRMG